MTQNSVWWTPYDRSHICRCFFHFFKIMILWVVRGMGSGCKRVKNGPKWEKFCWSCSLSQELYIIWFSFMVLMFKMVLRPGVYFTFSKWWFSRLLGGGNRAKNSLKWQCLSCSISQDTSYDHYLWYICVKG